MKKNKSEIDQIKKILRLMFESNKDQDKINKLQGEFNKQKTHIVKSHSVFISILVGAVIFLLLYK